MREEFEKLPEIRKIMNENGIYFMNHSGWYEARDFKDFEYEQYINGAWYAYQEQQKKIDGALKELELLNYYRTGNSDNAIRILKGTSKMTPTQIKDQAPQGATHYDIEGGKAVYYKVNNLGYTMRYDGVTWYALYGALIQNYKPL